MDEREDVSDRTVVATLFDATQSDLEAVESEILARKAYLDRLVRVRESLKLLVPPKVEPEVEPETAAETDEQAKLKAKRGICERRKNADGTKTTKRNQERYDAIALHLRRSGKATIKDICESLDIEYMAVFHCLKDEWFEKTPDGKAWQLSRKGYEYGPTS